MTEDTDKPKSKPNPEGPRTRLVRHAAVLQLKLVADGLRDAALIPISLIAALIGLIRGGEDADREFRSVIRLGRHSERWINLFGHHLPLFREHPAGSLDTIIDRVESVVREQVRRGATTEAAEAAIEKALEPLHRASRDDGHDSASTTSKR